MFLHFPPERVFSDVIPFHHSPGSAGSGRPCGLGQHAEGVRTSGRCISLPQTPDNGRNHFLTAFIGHVVNDGREPHIDAEHGVRASARWRYSIPEGDVASQRQEPTLANIVRDVIRCYTPKMPNPTLSSDIRHYAVVGAEARLLQLSDETATIHRLFPELRNGAAQKTEAATASPRRQRRRSRRRSMSAAERNAVSERMKKYWAARRGGSEATGTTSSDSPAKATKTARRTAKRGPRTMSPEARKRISDAQKARWAKQRGEAKATVASSTSAPPAAAKGRRTAKRRGQGTAKRGPRKMSAAARKRISQAQKKRWAATKRAAQ